MAFIFIDLTISLASHTFCYSEKGSGRISTADLFLRNAIKIKFTLNNMAAHCCCCGVVTQVRDRRIVSEERMQLIRAVSGAVTITDGLHFGSFIRITIEKAPYMTLLPYPVARTSFPSSSAPLVLD